jgi:capsular polysaccharide biosynthesis protein
MEIDLNVQYYLDVVLTHWKAVAVVFVVATVAAAAVSYLQQPVYEATVTLVEESFEYVDNPRLTSADKTLVKYYATLAHTESVETRVVEALGSSLDPAEKVPGVLLSRVTVREDTQNAMLFRIKAQADTAQKAKLIANTWAEQYIEEVTGYQPAWSSQLKEVEQELEAAEAALTAFRTESGVGLVEESGGNTAFAVLGPRGIYLEMKSGVWAEHQEACDDLGLVLESAREARDTGGSVEGLPLQLLSTRVISDRGQVSIESLRELGDLNSIIRALEEEEEALSAVTDRIRTEVEVLQQELADDQLEFERLVRARDLAESNHKALRDQMQEGRLFQTNTQIVSRAGKATLVGPDTKLSVIMGAALGLAGGLMAAFVLEYFEELRKKRAVRPQ